MSEIEKVIKKVRSKYGDKTDDVPLTPISSLSMGPDIQLKSEEYKMLAGVIEEAEKQRKLISVEIQGLLASAGVDRVRGVIIGGVEKKVIAYTGKSVSIKKEALLSAGVGMDQIEAATQEKVYVAVGVYDGRNSQEANASMTAPFTSAFHSSQSTISSTVTSGSPESRAALNHPSTRPAYGEGEDGDR